MAQVFAAATRPPVCSVARPTVTSAPLQAPASVSRRHSLAQLTGGLAAGIALLSNPVPVFAEDEPSKLLCDAECQAALAQVEKVKLPSGLQFQDIKVGTGPTPPVGYQIVVNYVAMTPEGRVFDSSLERGNPYDIRIGAGNVIEGLDEGVRTMSVGGIRRLYIPGNMAFPKGLPAGPGRPRVPPASPVVFDVQLLYIPGLDNE